MGSKIIHGKKLKEYLPLLFLAVYSLLIFYITLYSRSFSLIRTCRLELFWFYWEWAKGSAFVGMQVLLNINLFYMFRMRRKWTILSMRGRANYQM